MHTLKFGSADPLDHVCRSLDVIRKMGFDLSSLRVDEATDGDFRVTIALIAHDPLSLGTLIDRVSSYIGVYDLVCEVDGLAASEALTP